MGYASTLLYGDNFQVGGVPLTVTIKAIASNSALGSIVVPSDMNIRKVYVDMVIRSIENTSANPNYLDASCVVQCEKHVGGTWTEFLTIPNNYFYTLGSSTSPGIHIFGYIDVSAEFAPGETIDFRMFNADALADDLILRDVQVVARVIMR